MEAPSPSSSSSQPQPSTSKAAYCLQNAYAAKAAGTAALQANNLRGASFQYKKVYLFLAEYLPEGVATPSTQSPGSIGGGGGGNNGLVQMLQQQRRPSANASPVSTSSASLPLEIQQEMLQLYATTLNNLALVHLKLGRYREGVTCATAILEMPALRAALDNAPVGAAGQTPTPTTVTTSATSAGKALLRRASCFAKLGEWTAAEADVKTLMDAHAAANVAPDPALAQLTEAIRAGRKTETAKEKKMMQRMFS